MNSTKILITLLVVVAVSSGIYIFLSMNGTFDSMSVVSDSTPPPITHKLPRETAVRATPTPTPSPSNTNTPPIAAAENGATLPDISPDHRAPGASASPAEQQAYLDLLSKNSQAGNSLALGANCAPTPISLRIQMGKTLLVKNTDSKDHTLHFREPNSFMIPAGASKEISTSFLDKSGIYGYGCDSFVRAVGVVVVTK